MEQNQPVLLHPDEALLQVTRDIIRYKDADQSVFIQEIFLVDQEYHVTFDYNETKNVTKTVTLTLNQFMKIDHFNLVYITRYFIAHTTLEATAIFNDIMGQIQVDIANSHKASKLLQLHFNRPQFTFQFFVELNKWWLEESNPVTCDYFLINPIYKGFKSYMDRLCGKFTIALATDKAFVEDIDRDVFLSFLSCVVPTTCTSYPQLMMAQKELDKALNLQKLFMFAGNLKCDRLRIETPELPQRYIGQNMVILMKFRDQDLFKKFFTKGLNLNKNEIHELSFSNDQKQILTMQDGIFYNQIANMYQLLIDSKILNPHERKLYLMFPSTSQALILIQGNQKSNKLLAEMLAMFFESLILEEPKISHLNVLACTFNNGLNMSKREFKDAPFLREHYNLRKQFMTPDTSLYDLYSQDDLRDTMKKLQNQFSLQPLYQSLVNESNHMHMEQLNLTPVCSSDVLRNSNFLRLLFLNHLNKNVVQLGMENPQNPVNDAPKKKQKKQQEEQKLALQKIQEERQRNVDSRSASKRDPPCQTSVLEGKIRGRNPDRTSSESCDEKTQDSNEIEHQNDAKLSQRECTKSDKIMKCISLYAQNQNLVNSGEFNQDQSNEAQVSQKPSNVAQFSQKPSNEAMVNSKPSTEIQPHQLLFNQNSNEQEQEQEKPEDEGRFI